MPAVSRPDPTRSAEPVLPPARAVSPRTERASWVPPASIAVAINPSASFGTRRDVGPRVVARLRSAGYEVGEIVASDMAALRIEVARAIADGVHALVVVGGDGMVSLGVNLVAGTAVPLGLVPSGTGNDAARGLGVSFADTDAAVAQLLAALRRPPRRVDLGRVSPCAESPEGTASAPAAAGTVGGTSATWFFGAVSAGFDAIVNERANRMVWPRGPRRYTVAILRELVTLRPKRYEIVVDGVTSVVDALLLSVANNGSIGGGMKIVPSADLEDGLLDLFIVTPMSRLSFLRLLPKVFSGSHVGLPVVSLARVSLVRMTCADGAVAYADGERIGRLPIRIELVAGALRVLA